MRIIGVLCLLPICLAMWSQGARAEEGPRLKFKKKGPVCMCGDGLDEKDIRAAQRLRELGREKTPTMETQQSKITRRQDEGKEE